MPEENQPISFRASSMPRITRCPGSATAEGYGSWNPAADLGTAVHVAAAQIVRGEHVNAEAIALSHGVPQKDVDFLLYRIGESWAALKEHFPEPKTEVTMSLDIGEDVRITGTADVIADCGTHIAVLDWKSGRKENVYLDFDEDDEGSATPIEGHGPQVLTYAMLAAAMRTEWPMRVYTGVVWLRTLEIDARFYSAEELAAWRDRLVNIAQRARAGELRVGSHCGDCPACPSCPAFAQRSLVVRDETMPAISAENVFQIHSIRQALERRCKEVGELVKAFLTANGPVPIGEDQEMRLIEKGRKEVKLNDAAWELLLANHTTDQLYEMLTVRLTKFQDVVKGGAPRGDKKKAAEEAVAALADTGAVTENVHHEVKIAKREELAEGKE